MYGRELYQSKAIHALESFHHCLSDIKYGGSDSLREHVKIITGQLPALSDTSRAVAFQLMVMAPLWRALIDNDTQFFIDLGKAIEQRNRRQKELPQHYRLLAHMMSRKKIRFIYTYENIAKIAAPNGETNVSRLLKDLGLSLFDGHLLSQVLLPKEKRRLKASFGHK